MLTHSPLSLDETLNDPQFEEWLGGYVGTAAATTAINAVDDFATQSPETQQTLALLARYYLASRRPPAWATRHWRQPA